MGREHQPGQEPDYIPKPNAPPDNPDDIETDHELERQNPGEDDIKRNPGIGMSKGTTIAGADAEDLEDEMSDAENTFQGDVESDAGRPGTGVDPNRRGRHNK